MAAGNYTIAGSAYGTISISASDAGSVTGLAFTELSGHYNGGTEQDIMTTALTGQVAPTAVGKTLILGGKLSVAANMAEGIYFPDFNLEVNHE